MANIYVRSTDGNNADGGTTWALAKATLAGAAAIDVAGDSIYVSQSHAESGTGGTLAFAGTAGNPVRIICGNDGAEPPTAVADTATYTFSTEPLFSGSLAMYGGSVVSSAGVTLNSVVNHVQTFDGVDFSVTGDFKIGVQSNPANPQWTIVKNCTVTFNVDGGIVPSGKVVLRNVVVAKTVAKTFIFGALTGEQLDFVAEGCDFSNITSSADIVGGTPGQNGRFVIRDCRLPASWTGLLVASGSTVKIGTRIEMHNCDSGDTNYRMQVADYAGTIREETTIVRSGGASDGVTPLSWKMVSNANATYSGAALLSCEIAKWNDTSGSAITATIEVVTDGVTLKDDECWIEVQYLGSGSYPVSSFANDTKADVLAAGSNQSSSSETWTTTGLASPVKQKLSVTFTPQEKGFIHAVVHLAKASTTVYVDPLLTIT